MLEAFEQRMLDLANRLTDMTPAEWERVKHAIDRKFEYMNKELNRQIQLSHVDEKYL